MCGILTALYAASNAGSLGGLVAYPFLIEPTLALGDQSKLLAFGAVVAAILVVGVGLLARPVAAPRGVRSPRRDRLRWLGLSALAASLLASGSAHLSTDVAPVPLVWVAPLSLYLLSFVVVFSGWSDSQSRLAGRILPMGLVFLSVALATRAAEPLPLVAGLHLTVLFLGWLVLHGELARTRPPASQLTGFYLTIAVGGAAGGLFNAALAPLLFARVGPAEYQLGVVLLALVRPLGPPLTIRKVDVQYFGLFAMLTIVLILGIGSAWPSGPTGDVADDLINRVVRGGLLFGLPAAAAFALVARPLRFAMCLAVLLGCAALDPGPHGRLLHTTRNFFGTLRVTVSPDGRFTRLVHGTTQHGQEDRTTEGRPVPLMYYHPTGPAGRLIASLPPGPRRVAAVGLGCGALAAYARPGDAWTFYEVDPAVETLARDPAYFRALASAPAFIPVVIGDARRTLADVPDGSLDLLVLDAFNSDAVPTHLLTREAFTLYAQKLKPDGVILAHLSNVYLDLVPVFAAAALECDPPFQVRFDDDSPTDNQREAGKTRSLWAVAVAQEQAMPSVARNWMRPKPSPRGAWRDDFADLLSAWRWGE